MLNDLLFELEKLSQSRRSSRTHFTAIAPNPEDIKQLENAILEAKTYTEAKTSKDLPRLPPRTDSIPANRRARRSSDLLPESLRLRIRTSRSVDSLLLSPLAKAAPIIVSRPDLEAGRALSTRGQVEIGSAFPLPPRPRMHSRSFTAPNLAKPLPNLEKPLPPPPLLPKTPKWEFGSPVTLTPTTAEFLRHPSQFVLANDVNTALLLDNIALEPDTEAQLPFIPGQSYRWLPGHQRRGTNDNTVQTSPNKGGPEQLPTTLPSGKGGTSTPALHDFDKPATRRPITTSFSPTAPLEKQLPPLPPLPPMPSEHKLPPMPPEPTSTTPTTTSPSRRLLRKTKTGDPNRPRNLLFSHTRSRTLSPERSPPPWPMLAKRAQSARESRKKGKERRTVYEA